MVGTFTSDVTIGLRNLCYGYATAIGIDCKRPATSPWLSGLLLYPSNFCVVRAEVGDSSAMSGSKERDSSL